MWTFTLGLGCAPDERDPTDPLTAVPVTSDEPVWGVVDGCEEDDDPTGFDPIYDGSAVVAHGTSDRDVAFVPTFLDWYGPWIDVETVPADSITDEQKSSDLIVLGSPDSNPLLLELDGLLPVRFREDGSFEFGGYLYDEPGHGIALISPNPWNDEQWILLYAGVTFDGMYSTFTVYTGWHDYATVRGGWTLQQQGTLCRDQVPWGWYRKYDEDLRKPWDAWVGTLEVESGEWHILHFEEDSDGDQDRDWLLGRHDEDYLAAAALLEVEPLDVPIRTYLYTTTDLKEEMTGYAGYAHANPMNAETHHLYGEGVDATGPHEDVHVLAWHRIGDTSTSLMGEGLAVWVGGYWWGEPLDDWASEFLEDGEIPPLEDLIDDFWGFDDTVTYPLAGHFVGFLVDTWGLDAMKRLYTAPDLEEALLAETGLDLDGVEAAWLLSIP